MRPELRARRPDNADAKNAGNRLNDAMLLQLRYDHVGARLYGRVQPVFGDDQIRVFELDIIAQRASEVST